MAQADWTELSDNLNTGAVVRGVVTGGVVSSAPGGGAFAFGFGSKTNSPGSVALYSNLTGLAPTAKGGTISGAIQKGLSAGNNLFCAFLFAQLTGTSAADPGYLLGLSDSDPAHIILRKGALGLGLPDVAPGSQGVLRRSTAAFTTGIWLHLKLDCIKEPNGDMLLQIWRSISGDVTAPLWNPIGGMADFTDDNLEINTGSAPLTSGRMGFGMTTADISRRVFVDQVVTAFQE